MNHLYTSAVRRVLFTCAAALLVPGLHAEPAALKGIDLGRNLRGEAAIAAARPVLPQVAKAYGLSPEKLEALLREHRDLGIDRHGHLHYVCEGLTVSEADLTLGLAAHGEHAAAETTTTTTTGTVAASTGVTDVFRLHSLPGSPRVIYLDFDGHTTSGTQWNTSYTGGQAIVSAPFDADGIPGSFSAAEQATIQRIWQRVAEDYAPFAVNVTTEDPGLEALRRTSSTDLAYGVRVVISPTNWQGSAGGIAYVGSFNWGSDTPAFAFTRNLANSEKPIAECSSHEAGHALGLHHEGLTSGTTYYSGQGGWAPIMGNSYYAGITQWAKGEYANANNTEDQLAIIPTYGPAVLTDDHGNALSAATVIPGASIATGGTIERRTDVDVFRFTTGAGAVLVQVSSPAAESNLNLKADLLDGAGNVLQTATSAKGVTFSRTLAAGTYYLRLDGVGSGDPLSTGYSDYASLGNYVITGTLVATGANQPPSAVLAASATSGTAPVTVTFNGTGSTDADGTIASYAWDFGNGQTAAGATASCTYSAAGTYIVVLTVTDNAGASSSASTTISVQSAPTVAAATRVDISRVAMSTIRDKQGMRAFVAVDVRDQSGRPVAGIPVRITWTGVVASTSSGVTDGTGQFRAKTRETRVSGVQTATATLEPSATSGYTYDPALLSAPTTGSIQLN